MRGRYRHDTTTTGTTRSQDDTINIIWTFIFGRCTCEPYKGVAYQQQLKSAYRCLSLSRNLRIVWQKYPYANDPNILGQECYATAVAGAVLQQQYTSQQPNKISSRPGQQDQHSSNTYYIDPCIIVSKGGRNDDWWWRLHRQSHNARQSAIV